MSARLAYILRHDKTFDADALREVIYDIYAAQFEESFGCEDEVINALSNAIFRYRCATEDDLDTDKEFITNGTAAEKYFCACLEKILLANGFHPSAIDDYATWPDCISVETTWEKIVLRELALIQAGHDLVVRDQLKKLWAEEEAKKEAAVKAE